MEQKHRRNNFSNFKKTSMKTINKKNIEDIYISKSTKELITKGFVNKDSLVDKTSYGYSLTLEPIFAKSEETLKRDRESSKELEFVYDECLIFDFERKGTRKPSIIKDKIFIYGCNEIFDFNGNIVKRLDEFDYEHAYGVFDKFSNRFYVICKNVIYVYDQDLKLIFKVSEFEYKGKSLDVSLYQTILFENDFLICGYGSKYSKSFLVKYDNNGSVIDQIPLERGFSIIASNSTSGIVCTYHESKGKLNFYDTDLKLIKQIAVPKKLNLFKISDDGKYCFYAFSNRNKLFVLVIENLDTTEFKVHPFGKNYKYKSKEVFRHVNNFWISKNSEYLIVAGDKYLLNMINLSNNLSTILEGHEHVYDKFYNGVEDLKFIENEDLIITSASDYQIIVWDYSGAIKARLIGHTGIVSSFDVSENLDVIVSSSVDGTVRIWKRKKN